MAEYTCTLSEADLEKARTELHEDPKDRMGAVAEFRRWLDKDAKHIKCPTDTSFLLKFLRNAKYSQLVAREKLENYFRYGNWCAALSPGKKHAAYYHRRLHQYEHVIGKINRLDTFDPKIQAVWKTPFLIVLPKTTPQGCKVLLMQPGKFDPLIKSGKIPFTPEHVLRAGMMSVEYALMDESTQVNGVVFLNDLSGASPSLIQWMTPERMRTFGKLFERGMPLRIKNINYYNGGALFDIVMAIITTFMSEKLRSRIKNHGSNMETVYNNIPPECLPEEYLPDDYKGPSVGSMQSCIDRHLENMMQPAVRRHIMEVTDRKYGIDDSRKVATETASFRKLAVD